MERNVGRMLVVLAALTLPVAFAAGCGDGKSAPTPTSSQAKVSETDLAVPADYEDEVDGEITSDNYKAELAKAEAEIAK